MIFPPAKPMNPVATVISSTRIDFTWRNMSFYDEVEVWRKVGEGSYVSYGGGSGSCEYFEDSNCDPETAYCYKVKGITYFPDGESEFSDENGNCGTTFATLWDPSELVATAISDTEIDVTFKDNSATEDSHRLERKLGAEGEYSEIATLPPNVEFYRDSGLVKGETYFYKARARQNGSYSPSYSNVDSATTISEPTKPVLAVILAADIQDKSIRIRWLDVANETGYRIEKSDDDSFEADEGELIAVVGAGVTDFLVTGLTPGTQYWFRIRAYNAAGNSVYSDVRTDSTLATYVPTAFEKFIRHPNIEPVYLAEVNPKITLEGFPLMSDDDLVGCWPFDEGSGIAAKDKSKQGNDGTLYPTPVSISACDVVTDWTSNGSLSIDTEDKKEGIGSLKDNVASPIVDTQYSTNYNPSGSWDWSNKKHILFWLKSDRASTAFGWCRLLLYDTSNNYRIWYFAFSADEWTELKFLLSAGDYETEPPPDLALVDRAYIQFKAADTDPFHKKIDDLRIDDRPQWVDGKVNKCLDFDGEDDWVLCGNLTRPTNFTVSGWVNITDLNTFRLFMRTQGVSGRMLLMFKQTSGEYYWSWADGDDTVFGSATAVPTGEWCFITVTYDGVTLKAYLNGDFKQGIDVSRGEGSAYQLKISQADTWQFKGLIDEIRIYKRTLTATEIKVLYDTPGHRIHEFPITDRAIVDFDKVFESRAVDEVAYTDEYTKKASKTEVQANASSFWLDPSARKLYIHTSAEDTPSGFLLEGGFWMYMSNKKDMTFNGNFYLPLLSKEDIPDISQEIKSYFEGSFSISSGSIAFINAKIKGEHFFDKRFGTYTWINAKTILKAGGPDFTYVQFKEIFTALINEKACSDEKATFQLRDIREEMENKIILNKFNKTDFPGMEEKFIDKPRPIYFGGQEMVTPVCIDEIDERFECNDGRVKSIDTVYKNNVLLVENTHYYVDLQRARITFDRDGQFIIVANVNNKISFQEAGGSVKTATLDADTYTTVALCAHIKAKMEAANALIYTVTVDPDTKKFKIAAPSEFALLWKTGPSGSDNQDTHVGTTIGFYDDEDDTGKDSYEAGKDVISVHKQDIIGVRFTGLVNSADEPLYNGAEIFKYLMNNYKGLADSELNLDSIYEAKYANEDDLAVPIESEISFDEIVRSIEHSIEAYTFQDVFGRLGIRPQQIVVASKAKYIISSHTFDHVQKKGKSSLFWKVNVHYNKNLQTDDWEWKTATDDEILWKYGVTKELDIYTYFSVPSHASDLATSILNLLNKEQIEDELPMLLFDVMPGDLVKFSRGRFYDSSGVASEIILRIIKISKSPASGKTTATMEKV